MFDAFHGFEVEAVYRLDKPVPRAELTRRSPRTLFFTLEHGLSKKYVQRIASGSEVGKLLEAHAVAPLALQLPAAFTQLVINGTWRTICVRSSVRRNRLRYCE